MKALVTINEQERKLLDSALSGIAIANSIEPLARQDNVYGGFSDALRKLTMHLVDDDTIGERLYEEFPELGMEATAAEYVDYLNRELKRINDEAAFEVLERIIERVNWHAVGNVYREDIDIRRDDGTLVSSHATLADAFTSLANNPEYHGALATLETND